MTKPTSLEERILTSSIFEFVFWLSFSVQLAVCWLMSAYINFVYLEIKWSVQHTEHLTQTQSGQESLDSVQRWVISSRVPRSYKNNHVIRLRISKEAKTWAGFRNLLLFSAFQQCSLVFFKSTFYFGDAWLTRPCTLGGPPASYAGVSAKGWRLTARAGPREITCLSLFSVAKVKRKMGPGNGLRCVSGLEGSPAP